MAKDHTPQLQAALETHLKANAGFAALFGARLVSLKGSSTAQTPYAVIDTLPAEPYEATCLDGARYEFNVHTYVNGEEEEAQQANKVIQDALNDASLDLGGAHTISMDWVRSVYFADPYERGLLHGVVTMLAVTSDDF